VPNFSNGEIADKLILSRGRNGLASAAPTRVNRPLAVYAINDRPGTRAHDGKTEPGQCGGKCRAYIDDSDPPRTAALCSSSPANDGRTDQRLFDRYGEEVGSHAGNPIKGGDVRGDEQGQAGH